MLPFFLLFPSGGGGRGGGMSGKDALCTIIGALVFTCILINFLSWTVDRNFPDQCSVADCGTYFLYVKHTLRQCKDVLAYLW